MTTTPEARIRAAVDRAEEVCHPLDDLLPRTAADAGAPFTPDVLDALRALKREDQAQFERLRAQLKRGGCRVTKLDEALASGRSGHGNLKQADRLIALAREAELFHSPDTTAFADLHINGHRETWPIRGNGFRRWLTRQFFEATDGAPNAEALQSALNALEATAHFAGPEREVHLRMGSREGRFYVDLGDPAWRAVEICPQGWHVVDNPPIRFRRATGMQPLPTPEKGGSIDTLRHFLNVQDAQDFVLVVAWALAALRDAGPYPVLVLSGEQGSAKSTFSTILRSLLDPRTAPLRALPREERDLFITATHSHVLAFDNVSGLPPWISDALCRIATGGGFAVRQLYTDQEEVLFDAARPVILNGIEDIVTRPDLADRAIFLTLAPIPEARRRTEQELWSDFNTARPQLLGSLLDAIVYGLRRLPETRLERLPRLADFARWATACETAFWPEGTFGAAYTGNRNEAVDTVIDADPVGSAICALMTARTDWAGTASDLLNALEDEISEKVRKMKTWPSSPRALSGRVRRAAASLRTIGIDVAFDRAGHARTRTIRLTRKPEFTLAEPSSRSALPPDGLHHSQFSEGGPRTVAPTEDACAPQPDVGTVRSMWLPDKGPAPADGADARTSPFSGSPPREREKAEQLALDEHATSAECDGGLPRTNAEDPARQVAPRHGTEAQVHGAIQSDQQ